MRIQYSSEADTSESLERLGEYRNKVRAVIDAANFGEEESSLATWQDDLMRAGVQSMAEKIGPVTDVILIGIGGSSLGTEAVHAALRTGDSPRLHVLDTISDTKLNEIISAIKNVKREDLAVCAISKSGGTTETLSNIAVVLDELKNLYGEVPYDRTVFIGNGGNPLLTKAEELGGHVLPMHEGIGGRYSVFTSVGLLPLKLLDYDTDALLEGLKEASAKEMEELTAESASVLYQQMLSGTRLVNFFAFDVRLETMGAWYRQLVAESIGKEFDRKGEKVEIGFVPTISTPVELHSIGQLYFSGFSGVYTDFVSLDDRPLINYVPNNDVIAEKVAGKSLQEVAYAIEGGVIGAYEERKLPFRHTEIKKMAEFDMGLFMGARMMETMYLAELMDVNAFDQPNVELYKEKTREILDNKGN